MNFSFIKNTGPFSIQWCVLPVILTGCLSLSACSQATPAAHSHRPTHSGLSVSADPNRGQPLRVIVKFRKPVPYREPSFLRGMGEKIHAPMAYVSSVSPDTHVYQINAQPGQDRTTLLRLLGSIPEVLSAETDAVAKPF